MLDEFASDNPDDYIAGFPPHPHRGFETVTYMLAGDFQHQDHLGHKGHLRGGGAQWMTAGRGIIHSDAAAQSGRLHGFQFWINLPAAEKMKPAATATSSPRRSPVPIPGGEVIAGTPTPATGQACRARSRACPPRCSSTCGWSRPLQPAVAAGHTAFLYLRRRQPVGAGDAAHPARPAGRRAVGRRPHRARSRPRRRGVLLLAARPLGEPVVQYGPFVMNTREEIEQALDDYRAGTLA
jgi:redox-sensitive bicupin YhaK (pirin superfamily)